MRWNPADPCAGSPGSAAFQGDDLLTTATSPSPVLPVNDLLQAQAELRYSYVRGGPGAFVSGLVWLAAAITADSRGVAAGFTVLFFGFGEGVT